MLRIVFCYLSKYLISINLATSVRINPSSVATAGGTTNSSPEVAEGTVTGTSLSGSRIGSVSVSTESAEPNSGVD